MKIRIYEEKKIIIFSPRENVEIVKFQRYELFLFYCRKNEKVKVEMKRKMEKMANIKMEQRKKNMALSVGGKEKEQFSKRTRKRKASNGVSWIMLETYWNSEQSKFWPLRISDYWCECCYCGHVWQCKGH